MEELWGKRNLWGDDRGGGGKKGRVNDREDLGGKIPK